MAVLENLEDISLPIKIRLRHCYNSIIKKETLMNSSKHLWQAQATYVIKTNPWLLIPGASNHMTNEGTIITEYTKLFMPKYVKLDDGTSRKIIGKGSVKLNHNMILRNVLNIPDLRFNLLYVRKLMKDTKCIVEFSLNACYLQDISLKTRLAVLNKCKIPSQIILWHMRLGFQTFNI